MDEICFLSKVKFEEKNETEVQYMANMITFFRMVCSIILLFIPTFSSYFYSIYIISGISDMLDGFIARKTNTASNFGAKWDSIADFLFFSICLIKMLPLLQIPGWLWIWIVVVALMKLIFVIYGFIVRKTLIVEHTLFNKITGFLLFTFPLTLSIVDLKYSATVVIIIATLAAIQEGYYIMIGQIEV